MQELSLSEAVAQFTKSLALEEVETKQQELYRFARWYGLNRPIRELTPSDVSRYSAHVTSLTKNSAEALEPVRFFLSYARKQGLVTSSLASSVRAKKALRKKTSLTKSSGEAVPITSEEYVKLKEELESLEQERSLIAKELSAAAADKDFRENAPLEIAREKQGHLESRIRAVKFELEQAAVVTKGKDSIELGSTVVLIDQVSGERICFVLVHPSQIDPAKGKISISSPIGKALLGGKEGEFADVEAPVGVLCYRIDSVG